MKKYRFRFHIYGLLLGILVYGCKPTKYVPSDKYLLNKVKISCDNKKINQLELKSCLRQKENKRILGMRYYLGLYNLSSLKKTKGINKKLRDLGEEPAIWDPALTHASVDQIKNYLVSKGYMNAEVRDSVIYKKRKVDVSYRICAKTPYTIRSMKYVIEDTSIQRHVFADTSNIKSHLKVGEKGLFDIDLLGKERSDIEYYMRNRGFFRFTRDLINYEADTSANQVDLVMNVTNEAIKLPSGQIVTVPHKQYKINQVVILTENDRLKKSNVQETSSRDTILKYGVKFVYQNNFWVRPSIIQQSNYILPGSLFRISDVEETKSHLASLNVFSIVNTNQFIELPASDTAKYHYLDCHIRLTPLPVQSFDWGLVGTNSNGNFGGAVTGTYQHRSLFGNAENLNIKVKWALEALQDNTTNKISRDLEYGAEATLNIPKFLIPFNSMSFKKKYNPKTYFTLAYNYQDRPEFKKKVANISFGYNWKGARYKTHIITPMDINFVDIWKSAQFDSLIHNTYLENLYYKHLVTASSYTYTYDNQDYKKRSDYRYFRTSVELSGNLLTFYNKLTKAQKDSTGSYYSLFNLRYSQYFKTEVDFHYFHVMNAFMGTAYRLFFGIGVPYGNNPALPYEKQFFSGGANGVRGWQARNLGPGSYTDTISIYPNSTGDMKLEGNIEYRFKLFGVFEGALFTDAGNIWLLPSKYGSKPKNAIFKWNQFYKQIAVSSGVGLRFNFTYFLLRVDLGLKMHDPAKNKWIYDYGKLQTNDFALSFAIGYPF